MASYKDRQRIGVVLVDDFDFDNSLDYILNTLNDIKSEYPDYSDFRFNKTYWELDDIFVYELVGYRLETDVEYANRLNARKADINAKKQAKAKAKANKEEAERAEYERLRAKFERNA